MAYLGTGSERFVALLDEPKIDLLRSALGDDGDVEYLPHGERYGDPPAALQAISDLVAGHNAEDRGLLRVIGELPPMNGLRLDAWLRYESAVNDAFSGQPVRVLCTFDTRSTPPVVQEELLKSHPLVATTAEEERNARYQAPEEYFAERTYRPEDPLEASPPALEFVAPSTEAARRAIAELAAESGLEDDSADGLVLATNEILTNALIHGREPIALYGWNRPGRALVAVRDGGDGPQDPTAGLLPAKCDGVEGGRGLWLAHKLCPEIALSRSEEGFTVRLAAGM